jgi:DNA-binding IclR family transcriptional regulator
MQFDTVKTMIGCEAGMTDEEPIKMAEDRKLAKSGRGIQSVDRALNILEMLAQSRQGLPLMQLSVQTGLNFSTCHHLLATMARRGYVSQDKHTKYYFLGNRIFGLSDGRTQQLDLLAYAKPALEELNRRTGEAVRLLACCQGRQWLRGEVEGGSRDGYGKSHPGLST